MNTSLHVYIKITTKYFLQWWTWLERKEIPAPGHAAIEDCILGTRVHMLLTRVSGRT